MTNREKTLDSELEETRAGLARGESMEEIVRKAGQRAALRLTEELCGAPAELACLHTDTVPCGAALACADCGATFPAPEPIDEDEDWRGDR